MVISDSLDDHLQLNMKVVWNSAMEKSGALSVMTSGETQMPMLCAGSLAFLILVNFAMVTLPQL